MNDVVGYIRVILPRYALVGQKDAMERNGVANYLVEGGKRPAPTGTRQDVLRMMRSGRLLAVQHLFLLADPRKRSGQRADLWKAIAAVEDRGGAIWELCTGRKSSDRKERDGMIADAIEALARGRHKRSASDKRGRPPKEFSEAQWKQAHDAWHSRKLKTWLAVKAALPKGFTLDRAYRKWGARDIETT